MDRLALRALSVSSAVLSFAVFVSCSFVDVTWKEDYLNPDGSITEDNQFSTSGGVAHCRYFGLTASGAPKDGFDATAAWCAFFAFVVGVVLATMTTCCCCCGGDKKQEPHNATFLGFILCSLLQSMTFLVFAGPSCNDSKTLDASCSLLWGAYVSIAATFLYLVCAIFAKIVTVEKKDDVVQVEVEAEAVYE